MSNPINHHHVPQTYLKNFSTMKKNEYYLYAYDKVNRKKFGANIKDVAVERDFYTVNNPQDKYVWENFYAKEIEPLMGTTIGEILKIADSCLINNKAQILADKQKLTLAVLMAFQLLRSKYTREFLHKTFKEKAPLVLEETKKLFMGKGNENLDRLLENYKIGNDMFKLVAMDVSLDFNKIKLYAQELYNRCWVVYRIVGNNEFVTSDNPIMFMNNQSLDVTPFHNGLTDTKTMIFYPISSKVMICLYDYELYLSMLKSYDCKLIFIDGVKEHKFINKVNKKQIEQSYRLSFCKTEEIFKKII